MLQVDIRELHRGPAETSGQLGPGDETFAGLNLGLAGPVEVRGQISQTGDQEFFWRGHLTGTLQSTCRRCLTDMVYPLDTHVEVLFSADPEAADDPSVYSVGAPVLRVDVRPAVREEVALAVSAFPLCREACAGLCPGCGTDLNTGPCRCTAPSTEAPDGRSEA